MKRKIIGILALAVLALSVGIYYHYANQPKNIFDEIYQETQKTYQSNNILGNIKGFDIDNIWPTDDSNIVKTPFGTYNKKSIQGTYHNVSIDFNFKKKYETLLISFETRVSSNANIWILSKYNSRSKVLTKTVQIILENGNHDKYIDNESEVKSYLKKYGITTKDLDGYYDKIVNQKVLKDWCSIYDSKFSPEDYGDVTVKTQWENW